MSDLIVTRCACCQQPLGLEPRIAGLSAELDHVRDCLADDQVYGLAQKNRADLAETRLRALVLAVRGILPVAIDRFEGTLDWDLAQALREALPPAG